MTEVERQTWKEVHALVVRLLRRGAAMRFDWEACPVPASLFPLMRLGPLQLFVNRWILEECEAASLLQEPVRAVLASHAIVGLARRGFVAEPDVPLLAILAGESTDLVDQLLRAEEGA